MVLSLLHIIPCRLLHLTLLVCSSSVRPTRTLRDGPDGPFCRATGWGPPKGGSGGWFELHTNNKRRAGNLCIFYLSYVLKIESGSFTSFYLATRLRNLRVLIWAVCWRICNAMMTYAVEIGYYRLSRKLVVLSLGVFVLQRETPLFVADPWLDRCVD